MIAVREFVSASARKFGFSDEEVSKIALAVDEACTNVIKHAYKFDPTKVITVTIRPRGRTFEVSIRDTGRQFNPSDVLAPDMKEYLIVVNMRQHKLALCEAHYLEWLPAQTQRTIEKYHMFTREDKILVAVSGGKDSLSVWDILLQLGYQADGVTLQLGIDEGIRLLRSIARVHRKIHPRFLSAGRAAHDRCESDLRRIAARNCRAARSGWRTAVCGVRLDQAARDESHRL